MTTTSKDLYASITAAIIADLEKGVRPWNRPWASQSGGTMRPLRHNGQPYSGINVLLLWAAASDKGYSSPFWMTFNQAKEYGASVRKGEKATTVVYASSFEKSDKDSGEKDRIFFMKSYAVFNAAQIDNLPAKFPMSGKLDGADVTEAERNENADAFIASTGAEIRHAGDRAFYSPNGDYIVLPPAEAFTRHEAYYGTALHELAHWTGHTTRLARDFSGRFASEAYAFEELVAELTAAFLCADLGVEPELRPDHADYIGSWLKTLKNDKRAIFTAASAAQKAADFLSQRERVDAEPVAKAA